MSDRITQMLADQAAAEAPFTRFPDDMPAAERLDEIVVAPDGPEEDAAFADFAARSRNLARNLAGQPRLHLVHAQCVTLLRRRDPPGGTAALFCALWAGHGAALVKGLSTRWLISAATTFADHGRSPAQRQAGEGLSTLFAMLKLTETERLYSGTAPDTPFRPGRVRADLAMQMQPYAINGGDLDRVLITRIWRAGSADAATVHLTQRLLGDLVEDRACVFARLALMRARTTPR